MFGDDFLYAIWAGIIIFALIVAGITIGLWELIPWLWHHICWR